MKPDHLESPTPDCLHIHLDRINIYVSIHLSISKMIIIQIYIYMLFTTSDVAHIFNGHRRVTLLSAHHDPHGTPLGKVHRLDDLPA